MGQANKDRINAWYERAATHLLHKMGMDFVEYSGGVIISLRFMTIDTKSHKEVVEVWWARYR